MNNHELEWEPEALKRLKKAPFFIRKLAKAKVEKAARESGNNRVTVELMEKIKNQEMGK